MFWIIIIGVILAFVGTGFILAQDDLQLLGIILCVFGGMLIGLAITHLLRKNTSPTALDVYRGKTELEITEIKKDTITISKDTIVIFKSH